MSSKARLGGFVLLALTMFGVMVFLLGDRQFLFKRTYRLKAPFDSVAGLEGGAPVRAGGVRIGTVSAIVLPRQPGDKVTVEMEVDNSTRNVIKQDSVASIETEGLLGNKYMSLSFGSQQAAEVHDGDTIESEPPMDYSDLAKNAGELVNSAKEVIDSSKIAVEHMNQTGEYLQSITGKVNGGQGTIGALVNDRSLYQNLQATVDQARAGATSLQEDMEALKHNFLLRGFFKKRGYYDSSELGRHAVAGLPRQAPLKEFAFDGKNLFSKSDTAKLSKEKLLNPVGAFLESSAFGSAVVVTQTSPKGKKEENGKLAQARAMVVRDYLASKFKVDDSRIKTLALGESEEASSDGGRVAILVYPANGGTRRTVQAANK